ncbi:MAG: phytanoyl-CoA dioxygenase family protein [Candidatus Latescibacteria bacterium]|nr:phytanoyl-CoA dioxygenase family protein [Candidatus Latescibacterota bacterium]
MIDVKSKAREVNERGYCILEAVYNEDECQRMRVALESLCDERGGLTPDIAHRTFHPFLPLRPEMGPFFAKVEVVETITEVLQDDVRFAHSGGRVSGEYPKPFMMPWHNHYSWEIPPGGLNRSKPERIICNIYVDGSTPEVGQLVVLPRSLNDPIDQPFQDQWVDWPGQTVVYAPPGSVVIFDTALWHTAKRGNRPGYRHLCGGHYQGWHNTKPHHEDNNSDSPGLAQYKRDLSVLHRLIDGP